MNELRSLQRSVKAELADLSAELGSVRPLLDKLSESIPDAIEIRAVATTLHAFYNGVERILVLIAKHFQEPVGQSIAWHKDLLVQMAGATETRTAVISSDLQSELSEFLGFRHLFRHSYPMTLKWERIEPLVRDLDRVWASFHHEMELLLTQLAARGSHE